MKHDHEEAEGPRFDPDALFHDEEGYSYDGLAAYIRGEKRVCPLNRLLDSCQAFGYSRIGTAWVSYHYRAKEDEAGVGRISPDELQNYAVACAHRDLSLTGYRVHPKDASSAGRNGRSGAVAAPSAAVHPADEPEVPRGVGP